MQLYAGTSRISFRALDADGKPRKPAATTLDAGMQPSAVANDDGYLLVWMTQPSRFAVGDPPQPIFATKIGPEGSVQRQTRFDVPLSAGSGAHVAWNGRQYLIVTPRVALLIDSDLNLIRSINISVLGYCVDVSSADGQFLIASVTSDALKVAVISASGALGDPLTLGPRPFSAATSGSSIAWSDAAGVHAARLGADGIVADRVELQTGVSATGVGIGGDVASWFPYVPGPSNPTVSICTARIRVDPQTTCSPYAFAARGAAVAQSASTNVLAWIDGAGSTEDIRLDVTPRPVLPLPQATDPILSVAAQAQTSPVIERAPEGGSLVAWSEYNSAVRRTEIRMADIAADGTVRREWPVAASSRDQFGPAISPAADGDILVVWSEGSQFDAALRGAIVTTNSDRATVIEIGTGMAPSVAFNGGEWLVVWQTKPWGYNGSVRSSIVDHSGVWTPGGLPIAPDGSSQTEPAVVWSGRSFAVVWRETEPTGDSILFTTISTTNCVEPTSSSGR